MNFKRLTTRSLATLLTAGVLTLGLAAGAGAVIYVYSNGFGGKAAVKQMKRVSGGNQCGKGHRAKPKLMVVKLTGRGLCEFSPPVWGDSSHPDHVVRAKGQLLPKQTPKALRGKAYLSVKVRVGGERSYELRVRPRGRHFRLFRNPGSDDVGESGTNSKIKPFSKINTLRLVVKGNEVVASANGERLGGLVDPEASEIAGRRVAFGVGNSKSSKRSTVGAFKNVSVGIAD